MNSFASIPLLLLFLVKGLVPNMDLCCEVLKIPNLMEHYEEHKECNDRSFWQFLFNDYLNIDGDSQGHGEDSGQEDFPFHGNPQCCHPSVFYAPVQYVSLAAFEPVQQNEFGYHCTFHPSESLNRLFQPPRI